MRALAYCRPLFIAALWLASTGCEEPTQVFTCMPDCVKGTHCAESGCVPDDPTVEPDLAVAVDMATRCSGACTGATPYCGPKDVCVPCLEDQHCPMGTFCKQLGQTSACVAGCADDSRCGGGGIKCCLGQCIDTSKDAQNCGACGTACMTPNGGASCVAGKCTAGSCQRGWGDCNMDPKDGCETNLHTDVKNCAACGMGCSHANGISACSDGCYLTACLYGFEDCNQSPMDGCEVTTLVDPKNCGGCNTQCAGVPRAQVGCSGGTCALLSCTAGFGDCDGIYNSGCEINLNTDARNCGKCGNQCDQGQVCINAECTCPMCSFPNAVAACIAKVCVLASCKPGFADCDGKPVNGCELNTSTDSKNCGGCGKACAQGLVCANGGCTCPQCNIPNAKSACVNNVCTLDSCLPGYGDCDKNAVNGCEVTLDGDPLNCGACAKVCDVQNPFCLGGVCSKGGLSCNAILMALPNAKSGVYVIDPDGNGGAAPFSVYCDMTTASGGWTMMLNLDTSDGNVMWWANPLWENTDPYGDVNTPFDGDHKSPAWSSLSGAKQILLVVHEQGVYRGWKQFNKVDGRTLYQAFADNKDNTLIGDPVVASDTGNIAYAKERLVRSSTQLYANHCIPNGGSCTSGNLDVSPDGDRISSHQSTPANNDGGGLGNWHDMNLCCAMYGSPASGKTCIGMANFKSFRTASEAQAGWGVCWNANQGGTFGSDSFLPPANRCSDSCENANWASPSGVDYDYAIFLR